VARHSIIRRGRSYGKGVAPFVSEASAVERGLFFVCVNANISRQFEFIQQTWLNNPKFGGLHEGRDPLVGEAGPNGNQHRIAEPPLRQRLTGLPQFTRVRGGGYFFLPSRSALRFLSAEGTG
jgi:deferrochelatase/peroxidase EfeB